MVLVLAPCLTLLRTLSPSPSPKSPNKSLRTQYQTLHNPLDFVVPSLDFAQRLVAMPCLHRFLFLLFGTLVVLLVLRTNLFLWCLLFGRHF